MPLLGYALFSGTYGQFTVPVFEAPGFSFPSIGLTGATLSITNKTGASIAWNYSQAIYDLVPNPPRFTPTSKPITNPFTAQSSPEISIVAADQTAVIGGGTYPDDYYKSIQLFEGNSQSRIQSLSDQTIPKTACIFKLDNGKYYFEFSNNDVNTKEDTMFEFFFYHGDVIELERVVYGPSPVLINTKVKSGIVIETNPQYFYELVSEKMQRDWVRARISYTDGTTDSFYLGADDVIVTPSSAEITNLVVTDYVNIFGDKTGSLQLDFDRPLTFKTTFTMEFKLVSDENIKGTLQYLPIASLSGGGGIYTPGTGGGIESGIAGGNGNFGVINGKPEESDPVSPSLPGLDGTSGSAEGAVGGAGLFTHYAANEAFLKVIGDWLWADDLGLIIAKEVLSILYGSPIESAISLMSYPFNISSLSGVKTKQQEVFWGAHGAGFNGLAITDPYATIDWGTIELSEFWGNFLDYAPHTKLELYLPWCTGFVPIDPNECLPGTLRVVTNIELAKGTCLHNVIGNDERIIATHAGTCGKQLPLTALDTSGKALSLVSTAVSTAVAGTAGAAAQIAGNDAYGQFMQGAQQIGMTPGEAVRAGHLIRERAMEPHLKTQQRAKNMALAGSAAATRTPSHVQRSGSFSGSSAGLGVQFPYLILSRPTQSVPAQYGHHYGYPSNIYAPLSNLRGYTEVGEIHLTGFVANDAELNEIDSLLKGGVIL